MRLSTHAQRIDRWLGAEQAEAIARKTKGFHGPPIPLANVPGKVYVTGSGDFVGPIRGGYYASLADYVFDRYKRAMRNWSRRQESTLNTGFASIADFVSEAKLKSQYLYFNKSEVSTPATGSSLHLWPCGSNPEAGANAAGAPGGTIPDNTTTGGLNQRDPQGTDTSHFAGAELYTSGNYNTVMLYDYLFGMSNSINANSLAVTGVPTRYQGTDAAGSFVSARVTGALDATATNFTITYVDQDGNAAEAAPTVAARVSSVPTQIPLTQPLWYIPLNAGDTGVRKITNVASSGANTGFVGWTLGHPLVIIPNQATQLPCVIDGINSAFSLIEIKTGACLALLGYCKTNGTGNAWVGHIKIVSG